MAERALRAYHGAMQSKVEKTHIEITPKVCGGKPRITGTRIKVSLIAVLTADGMSPDEIVAAYPHLSLADVHAALAYYFDHVEAINAEIQSDEVVAEEMRRRAEKSP
jgi:uncharacterized protein (DUF433 family)